MRHAIGTTLFAMFVLLASPAYPQSKGNAGFDKLKSLVGNWEGATPKGEKFTTSWRLVSNGTALEETSNGPEDTQMVTLYTPDGARLAMTHYCAAGNQPHMETGSAAGNQKEYDFSFVSATNLSSPSAGHMQRLVVQLQDNDHFTETWTWREGDKTHDETFHFTRQR